MTAIHFNVKCPYCGHVMVDIRGAMPSKEVVFCGRGQPEGCRRNFVAFYEVIPTCKTKGIDDDVTAIT